jgi:hypothetical protein
MKYKFLREGEEKLLPIFGPWSPYISLKDGSGNFESMTTSVLLIEIYQP